jgi:predicted ester cyclase
MATAENKEIVRRLYEDVINSHNLDALDRYILADYVNHKSPGGLEGVKQLFSMLFETFPDLRFSVDSIGADGDRVWARTTMRGTQQGRSWGWLRPARRLRPRP